MTLEEVEIFCLKLANSYNLENPEKPIEITKYLILLETLLSKELPNKDKSALKQALEKIKNC